MPKHYCGPVALAALTGASCMEIEYFINRLRRRPLKTQVRGTKSHEIRMAAAALGYEMVQEKQAAASHRLTPVQYHVREATYGHAAVATHLRLKGETLRAFLQRAGVKGPWFIHITGHWIAVRDGRLIDTRYKDGVPARTVYRRCVVRNAWRLVRVKEA